MPRRAILIVASASALLAPQHHVTQTRRHSTTLNPLEQLAEQAQIKAYEASAAAIAATISAKVAEKGDRMPEGMVPIVQEFMRTYDLGVPSCGGAFTPSTRLVSISR